jgi:hypothetical protein
VKRENLAVAAWLINFPLILFLVGGGVVLATRGRPDWLHFVGPGVIFFIGGVWLLWFERRANRAFPTGDLPKTGEQLTAFAAAVSRSQNWALPGGIGYICISGAAIVWLSLRFAP